MVLWLDAWVKHFSLREAADGKAPDVPLFVALISRDLLAAAEISRVAGDSLVADMIAVPRVIIG